ncbi:EamA family transporter [Agarilytica rhodophyticola]|uniref:EamA family transporter n=1 Tax=Agarilytica rhodophyticola TaxID=1737490 RepID=UPI000B34758D|nr:EamA family transporter [Agarilytica rhodophyticola]
MTLNSFLIVFISVTLSAFAQLSFKYGVSSVVVPTESSLILKAWILFTTPFVFLGLFLYGVGTVLWLFALKQIDLSLAYPFVGMSFIMVFLMGVFFLNEPFNINRLIGTLVIIVGVVLLARS